MKDDGRCDVRFHLHIGEGNEVKEGRTNCLTEKHILRTLSISDIISILNALLGFLAIVTVTTAVSGGMPAGSRMMHALNTASLLILLAAAADGFDGVIARRVRRSPLGIYIDSFADMTSFGVATAIVSYLHLANAAGALSDAAAPHALLYASICGAYLMSGMLRLARFDAQNALGVNARGRDMIEDADFFLGFPITGSAVILSSFMLISRFQPMHRLIFIVLICMLSIMMCSRVRYRKLRNRIVMPSVAAGVVLLLILYALSLSLAYPALVVFIVSSAYLCSPMFVIIKQHAAAPR